MIMQFWCALFRFGYCIIGAEKMLLVFPIGLGAKIDWYFVRIRKSLLEQASSFTIIMLPWKLTTSDHNGTTVVGVWKIIAE